MGSSGLRDSACMNLIDSSYSASDQNCVATLAASIWRPGDFTGASVATGACVATGASVATGAWVGAAAGAQAPRTIAPATNIEITNNRLFFIFYSPHTLLGLDSEVREHDPAM